MCGGRRKAAIEVAGVRTDLQAHVVLQDVEAERAQLGCDAVGNRTLLARRRRQRRKLEEEVQNAHAGAIVGQDVAAVTP
jgi:hypothetical protein